jgi:hypothetical protein
VAGGNIVIKLTCKGIAGLAGCLCFLLNSECKNQIFSGGLAFSWSEF